MIAGWNSDGGGSEVLVEGNLKSIKHHPLGDLYRFGISRGEDCLFTFGGYSGGYKNDIWKWI